MNFEQLVERVIHQESKGDPNAVSPVGAAGLMQVMEPTAADPGYGVTPMAWENRFDAKENRRFGTEYLSALLNHYGGDTERALVAYNWGAGNANDWDGNRANLPAETQGYLANILGGNAPATSLRPRLRPEMLPAAAPAPAAPMLPPATVTPAQQAKSPNRAGTPGLIDLLNNAAREKAWVAAEETQLALLPF